MKFKELSEILKELYRVFRNLSGNFEKYRKKFNISVNAQQIWKVFRKFEK